MQLWVSTRRVRSPLSALRVRGQRLCRRQRKRDATSSLKHLHRDNDRIISILLGYSRPQYLLDGVVDDTGDDLAASGTHDNGDDAALVANVRVDGGYEAAASL